MNEGGHIEVNPDALHWLGGFETESNSSDSPNNQSHTSPTNQQLNVSRSDAKPKPSKGAKSVSKSKHNKTAVKPKKILSYAERFALEHGVTEEKTPNVEPQTVAYSNNDVLTNYHSSVNNSYAQAQEQEPDADILVIASAPTSPQYDYEDDLTQSFNQSMPVYNQSYDDDYNDYQQAEYPMDDQFCITSQHDGYNQAQSSSPPQPKSTFKRYTLNDYKHLPKEVKLGTLGSSADPVKLAEAREKQRAAKALAEKIRLSNLKRAQLAQADEKRAKDKEITQPKPKSKREIAAEFAKKVPKPRVSAASTTQNQTNQPVKEAVADDSDDEIQAMIREQEAYRVRVSKIKASMGLPD